eukprot:TRINITY_DN1829_c0_g1_i6.p1 TRINITY_DN1829_c0_g1~~TRINITY_DN1829_c0_g1_i6.p1  ORF type:complete len:134 (+),score=7.46 TRINITY_DN1829_c0_g1_i6:116-517(+)
MDLTYFTGPMVNGEPTVHPKYLTQDENGTTIGVPNAVVLADITSGVVTYAILMPSVEPGANYSNYVDVALTGTTFANEALLPLDCYPPGAIFISGALNSGSNRKLLATVSAISLTSICCISVASPSKGTSMCR